MCVQDLCTHCHNSGRCRVPHDLPLLARVCDRLEHEGRADLLVTKLHSFLDSERCLVEMGMVTLGCDSLGLAG